MELLFVHLTDIHLNDESDFDILTERTKFISSAVCTHITDPKETIVFLCITGDFCYSGLEKQYISVGIILEEVCCEIKGRFKNVNIYPIFVPGNHDCDFDNPEEEVRAALLESPTLDISRPAQVKSCTNIQKNFFDFCTEWKTKYNAMCCDDDKIMTINELKLEDKNINLQFHCINTSWCSRKHEVKGKMHISTGKMRMLTSNMPDRCENDIVITLMHHSPEWLDWEDVNVWNEYYKQYSDVVLVGHDHRQEYVRTTNYDNTTNEFIMGNQLYSKDSPDNGGFNILKIKTDETPMQESFFTYAWDKGIYRTKIDTGYHEFKKNKFKKSGIDLKKDICEELEDIGFDITNKSKRVLKLSDVFGFPTLKEERKKETKIYRDMSHLLSYIEEQKYISFQGNKEYGKTALLKQLFKYYYEHGKIPVFLDVKKINTADGEALNQLVGKRYEELYNNVSIDDILQRKPNELVCFIDNYDDIQLSDKSAKKFIEYLQNRFGIVIIARNYNWGLINPLSYVETNEFIKDEFVTLVFQPVRKSYMDRIITKWLTLEGTLDTNSLEFDAKRKAKYAEIANVMKGNYFNGTPMDLLLVLSYLEQEQMAQIDYSRYSFIYESLILSKLNEIGGNEATVISAYRKILQNIAYKMYKEKQIDYVNEAYIISVILDYKEKHSGFTEKTGDVIQKMIECSFLECKKDMYRFKHSYMFYYFIASHIERNLPKNDREMAVKELFCHIDEELNYNVALFVSHNMSVEHDIIPIVKELEEILLPKYRDFKYEDIKKLIEDWGGDVEARIKQIYTIPENENIPLLREERIKQQEESEISAESEASVEKIAEDKEIREKNAEVIRAGRLVDYMGNILKNYSGGMEDLPREEMITLMFDSALKIIGAFFDSSKFLGQKLIDMMNEKKKEDDEDIELQHMFIDIVKKAFADIWSHFVGTNILALATSLESDSIRKNIDNYSANKQNDFVRMTRVEYLLRIANTRLPVNEINALFKGKESLEEISRLIMKNNIYRYLSNYQFDNNDRRAVCDILEFNIKDVFVEEQKNMILGELQ